MKITNRQIQDMFPKAANEAEKALNSHLGLNKLARSVTIDTDKAYELSVLIPILEDQNKIIQENRNRISLKHFPLNEETGKQDPKDVNDPVKQEAYFLEFDKILDKEVEIDGDKIEISMKKDKDKKSELKSLGLNAVDLMVLKPIINVTK